MKKKKKKHYYSESVKKNAVSNKNIFIYLTIVLLSILTIALFYNQWVTLENFTNKIGVFANWGTPGKFLAWLGQYSNRFFNSSDKLVFWIIVIIPFLMFLLEYKYKATSTFFKYIIANKYRVLLLLIWYAIVTGRFYLAKGNELGYGDAAAHMSWIWHAFYSFKHHIFFPVWSYMVSSGEPIIMSTYSPAYAMSAGFISYILNDFYLGIKIYYLFMHFIMIYGTYLWVSTFSKNKIIGLITAIIIGVVYEFNLQIIYPGRYSSMVAIFLLPLLLYFFENFFENKKITNLISISILGTYIITSSFSGGYWAISYFSLYVFFRTLLIKKIVLKKRILIISIIALFIIIGSLLSIYTIYLGVRAHNGWIKLADEHVNLFSTMLSKVESSLLLLFKLINWNNSHFKLFNVSVDYWAIGYAGIINVLLFFLGFYFIIKLKLSRYYHIIILFLMNCFIFAAHNLPIDKFIPGLYITSFERKIPFVIYFIVPVTGICIFVLSQKIKFKISLLFLLPFLILLDLGPTTFQDTYSPNIERNRKPIYSYIKKQSIKFKNELPPYKAALLGYKIPDVDFTSWRDIAALCMLTHTPSIGTCHPGARIRSYEFTHSYIGNMLLANLSKQLTKSTLKIVKDGLYLINLKYMITDYQINLPGNDENIKFIGHTHNKYFLYENNLISPIIVSSRLEPLPDKDFASLDNHPMFLSQDERNKNSNFIFNYLSDMDINRNNNSAYRLYANVKGNHIISSSDKIKCRVITNKLYLNKVYIKVEVNNDCFARLSYSYHPSIQVKVNNKKKKIYRIDNRFLGIKLKKGVNTIKVNYKFSPFERFLLLIEIIIILLFIFLIYKQKEVNLKLNKTFNEM